MADENTDIDAGGGAPASDDADQNKDILNGPNSETEGKPPAEDDATGKDTDADGNSDGDGEKDGDDDQSGAPETYADFKLPEGVVIDEALLEKAIPVFKELGLTQEQAQKLATLEAERVQAGQESQIEAFNQMIEGWKEQSINDKEFGGDKFDESINTAQMVIDKLGTPELGKLLRDHGVGNHPEVIRILVKMGGYLKEDVPGGTMSQVTTEKSQLEALYPTEKS